MHLTSEDKRAARDGFAYVVLVGGKRKCYCTKHSEAKAEAGKSGKIVSLGRMRYTTQNPSTRLVPGFYKAKGGKAVIRVLEVTPTRYGDGLKSTLWTAHVVRPQRHRDNPSVADPPEFMQLDAKEVAKAFTRVPEGKLSNQWLAWFRAAHSPDLARRFLSRNPGSGTWYVRTSMQHLDGALRGMSRNEERKFDSMEDAEAYAKQVLAKPPFKDWRSGATVKFVKAEVSRVSTRNPWEAKRPANRYGVIVTNPRKYKHGKAAQLERLILRVSAHGKLTETQLQEILQGIRRAYPAGPKATAQKHIVGLIAKAKEQRIWPKVYNRLARL